MSKRTIFVSRSGMTPCPDCGSHFRVEASVAETTCPFCQSSFATQQQRGSLNRVIQAGRSGLLAASLFGVATLGAACGSDDDDKDVSDAPDIEAQPAYGVPADIMDDSDVSDTTTDVSDAPDFEVQPPYGIPADMTDPDINNDAIQPAYGLPADMADDSTP